MLPYVFALIVTLLPAQISAPDEIKEGLARAEALYFEAKFVESIQILARVNDAGIRTAIFMDADAQHMEAAAATGTQRVELYAEPYAAAFGGASAEKEFVRLRDASRAATRLKMGVNAGHDLNLVNTPRLAREVPEILEVSIGHALLADALYIGLEESVRRYVRATRGEEVAFPRTC